MVRKTFRRLDKYSQRLKTEVLGKHQENVFQLVLPDLEQWEGTPFLGG
jgi:hypothetical protein